MRLSINLGTQPSMAFSRREAHPAVEKQIQRQCRSYIDMVRRIVGSEPKGVRLTIERRLGWFGLQPAVICHYESDAIGRHYVLKCRSRFPRSWDEKALDQLSR